MESKEIFSQRLKALREEQGLSQTELAEKIGISRGSISFYENGDRIPDIEILFKIHEFFDVTADYLLGLDDSRNKESFKRLNQQLEDLGALINATENADGILTDLIWVLLILNLLISEKGFSIESIDILVRCFRQIISCMSYASVKTNELMERENININYFSDYGSLMNSTRKIATSALTLYFCDLMKKAAKFSETSKKTKDLQSIQNIFLMFLGNADFDKMKEELVSASRELGIIPPAYKNLNKNES